VGNELEKALFMFESEQGEISIDIMYSVFERAYSIFHRAGCPHDFCVQHATEYGIVFGGSNRLVWTPFNSFSADPNYCTESFIKAYRTITNK